MIIRIKVLCVGNTFWAIFNRFDLFTYFFPSFGFLWIEHNLDQCILVKLNCFKI